MSIAIREQLKSTGQIGKKDIAATRLVNLNLTEAQKSDWRNFQAGQLIQFNQNAPGIKRGSLWTVESSSEKGIFMRNDEYQSVPLPTQKSSHYELYQKNEINLAKGDSIRITRNGFDQEKNRLNNGQILDVIAINKNGEMVLRNSVSKASYKLDLEYGHLAHAYCVTSHASQGKTVDEVFISQPAATFPATNARQFYVSVSRGRHRARIYTDDKEQLMEHASQLGDRQSAVELISRKNQTQDMVHHHIRDEMARTPVKTDRPKEVTKVPLRKDRGYEPSL